MTTRVREFRPIQSSFPQAVIAHPPLEKGGPLFRPAKSRSRSIPAVKPSTEQRSDRPPPSRPSTTSHVINFDFQDILNNTQLSETHSTFFDESTQRPSQPPLFLASPSPTPEPLPSLAGTPTPILLPTRRRGHPVQTHTIGNDSQPNGPPKRKTDWESTETELDKSAPKKRRKSSAKPQEPGVTKAQSTKPKAKAEECSDSEEISASDSEDGNGGQRKKRRTKKPPLPPFDPDADPGEELDPTAVTMADLCEDTGQGRVSSKAAEITGNFVKWKAQRKAKRAEMRARQERKKYGLPDEEESEEKKSEETQVPERLSTPAEGNGGHDKDNDDPEAFDYSQAYSPDLLVAKVRTGPNGQTILDPDSLVVERDEVEISTEGYTHVVESDVSKFTNSGTYSKRLRGSRWSVEETELFYHALSQYGENYELIACVLPGRDRKACRNKFKAEDKKNHARVNYCLKNTIPVDMATLSRMTGKDFSGPVPEIKIPDPVVKPSTNVPFESSSQPAAGSSKPKKRARKAKVQTEEEEGVVILGNLDVFDENEK